MRQLLKKETVVRQHRPYLPYLVFLIISLGFLVACYTGFQFGQNEGQRRLNDIETENHSLRARLDAVTLELKEAKQGTVASELQGAMLSERLATLAPQIDNLTETVQELEDQAAYYRNLIKSSDGQAPIVIELAEWAYGEDGQIDFRVLLTRSQPSARIVKGLLKIEFVLKSRSALNQSAQTFDQQVTQAFDLKYFKRYEGSLKVPEGAVIQSAKIGVEVDGSVIVERSLAENVFASEVAPSGR